MTVRSIRYRGVVFDTVHAVAEIPRALASYPSVSDQSLSDTLAMRVQMEPFNALALF